MADKEAIRQWYPMLGKGFQRLEKVAWLHFSTNPARFLPIAEKRASSDYLRKP